MPVKPEFIITMNTKQGKKDFVLFAGLLDLGHQSGLIAIENEVLLDLSQPEKDVWVVRSTGRFRSEYGEAIWSAHGDASPGNSQMRGAYLRHAETRAAARMLRIATNVGMASVEELGPGVEDEREDGAPRATPGRQPNGQAAVSPTVGTAIPRPAAGSGAGTSNGVVGHGNDGAPCCTVEDCGSILSEREINGCMQAGWPMFCLEHARQYKAGLKMIEERKAEA